MRRALIVLSATCLIAPPLAAQTTRYEPPTPAKSTTGDIQLGLWNSDITGSPVVVSRYAPANLTSGLGLLNLQSFPEWGNLQLRLDARDAADQKHALTFDVNRVLRSTTTFSRFLPRFGHDPLTNLEAATTHGRVLRHTDLDPERQYETRDSILEHRTELQPSGLDALTVGFNWRDQRRSGYHQSTQISHCDNCHVYSQSRPIDEKQTDLGFDAAVAFARGYLKAGYTRRQLREDEPPPTLTFDRALQPELRTPIFDNRVQFDALNGALPVDVLQEVEKDILKADLHLSDLAGFVVTANGVWSDATNTFAELQSDYQGYSFSATRGFRDNKLRLRLRGRAYFIDNDDVFVDVVERPNLAPANVAGLTYRDIYGLDPDFTRLSSRSRDVYEATADLNVKLGKKAGSLMLLWNFQDVDRTYYEVLPGETKTTTNVLGAVWRPRPAKGLRLTVDYRHGFVDNPYMLVDGACSTLVSPGPLASPLDPRAAQYYQQREAQIAETTASAESWDDVRVRLNYSRSGKVNLTGSYRYWSGDNQAGDLTDWSRTNQLAMVSLSAMPSPTWDAYVSYSYQKTEMSNPICLPVFDG